MRAGLGELWLGLEFSLHGTGQRVDALVLGTRADGGLQATVVELKQWSDCVLLEAEPSRVLVRGELLTHPCAQVAGYLWYLATWVRRAELDLLVRGVAVLHNASPSVVADLRGSVVRSTGSDEIAVLGRAELDVPEAVRAGLAADGLAGPADEQIKAVREARHIPPLSLFTELERVLNNDSSMTLVGEQQDALLELRSRLKAALSAPGRHLILVTGGPGTGKSVIAVRLLAAIPKLAEQLGTTCTARYLTPSGTLRWQLERAAGPAGKGLFHTVRGYLKAKPKERHVPVVDEAQRIADAVHKIPEILDATRLAVLFLDEKQIILPNEGITSDALERLAGGKGVTVSPINLVNQFRCAGSQRYLGWVDALLTQGPSPRPWTDDEYDFATVTDPQALKNWVDAHTRDGTTARISAGFCWPWTKGTAKDELLDDVELRWQDRASGAERELRLPWNSKFEKPDREGNVAIPHSQAWATDPGGHEQVGCIYTAQGLEYPYSAVVLGPDLVRRNDRWQARPDRSWDPAMEGVTPEQYLVLAFNIYRVLLTRGTRGCRVYSTDPATQRYLEHLIPTRAGES
ncbi:DNA/RNA helicase domain-containing protein [Amycolatopsis cihanbeyliensis]|nr:DNA/RNA helicase domain-containing protein [Amycolatopsis cihanbeyliensis]